MRLIDADRLNPDRMTNKGCVAISQSQIAKAPTVNAIPIEVFDKIKAEIREFSVVDESGTYRISTYLVDQIIDKYRGKVDCRECKVEHDCYECEKYRESEG